MVERRLFIYKRSFKGNRNRATGEYIAKDLREAAKVWIWDDPSEHPENREPYAWEYSVYYWWWEFMRRHEGYRQCCERGGKGRYKKLYADWGNIHGIEYWDWWNQKVVDDAGDTWTRGEYLFAEPLRSIQVVEDGVATTKSPNSINISVPLEVGTRDLVKMFRRVLNQHSEVRTKIRSQSNALYPVAPHKSKKALYWALRAWDVEQETKGIKPKVKNHDKPSLMGMSVWRSVKSEVDKQYARKDFTRYLKAAEDYIYCAVEEGTFPKRRTKNTP